MSGIIIYGDPHGEWRPLVRACAEERPEGVVILGDCDLEVRFRQQLQTLFDAGVRIRWIPGNHDADTAERYDRLWGAYPEGNLHAAWARVGALVVAGLGGVFRERIWYPRFELTEPSLASRLAYMRQTRPTDRFRGGLPLRQRDSIFPEDAAALAKLRADILVTHEAPSCHRHGFLGIDEAAKACRARLVVHGHHHKSYVGVTASGIPVRGLARAEIYRVRAGDLP